MQPNAASHDFHASRKAIPCASDPCAKGVAKIVRHELYLSPGERTWVSRSKDALLFRSAEEARTFLRKFPAELVGAEIV